jgi:nucleoside-diphosphate-sugar epimerase
MRIFVTGATGVLGRHLVPGLVAAVGQGTSGVCNVASWREGFRAWVRG